MIEITVKFRTYEEAVLFLGKQLEGSPLPTLEEEAPPEVKPGKKQRKQRSDIGRSRGPYEKKIQEGQQYQTKVQPDPPEQPMAPINGDLFEEAPVLEAPALIESDDPLADSPEPEATPVPDLEEMQAAMRAYRTAHGTQALMDQLAEKGVTRISDVAEKDRAALLKALRA